MSLNESQDRSKETRPASLQFLILIGIVIVILGIIDDHNILTVVILYLLIILEAILCAVYVFGKATIFAGSLTKNRNNDYEIQKFPESNQRLISPIAIFLRSAVRGSEFSRNEIARIISDIVFEKFGERNTSGGKNLKGRFGELLNNDAQLKEDFRKIVLAYLPNVKSDQGKVPLSSRAYSQSVNRLVTRLLEYETKTSFVPIPQES